MVAVIKPADAPNAVRQRLRVLYVGPFADEIRPIFKDSNEFIAPAYATSAEEALFMARNFDFEAVVIDQRDEGLATRLILPLVASFERSVKLVVVSALREADAYKKIPGIARFIPLPLRETGVLRALGLERRVAANPSAVARFYKPAPMHQRRRKSDRKLTFPVVRLPRFNRAAAMAFSLVALMAIAGIAGKIFRDPLMVHITPAFEVVDNAELKKLSARIDRAENQKRQAERLYVKAQEENGILQSTVRDKLFRVTKILVDHDRNISVISRERQSIKTADKWRRSYAELKARQEGGLMDANSMQIGIMRVLKNDERLAELNKELDLSVAASKRARVEAQILQALADNLEGKAAPVPKPVPPELLPLIRKAAHTVAGLRNSRKQLDSAAQALEIFEDKRQQLKDSAVSMEGMILNDDMVLAKWMWQKI
jgi:hypothetical protein